MDNSVYKCLQEIYCCSGAEFCRPQLEAGWLEIERLHDQREALKAALADLVDLKDHKDRNGKDSVYIISQPKSWERARKVLDQSQ